MLNLKQSEKSNRHLRKGVLFPGQLRINNLHKIPCFPL